MLITILKNYDLSLLAIWVMLLTITVQALVASIAHRKQKVYIPGIVDGNLSHSSFVFRTNRTFMNSLENVPQMVLLLIVAILIGSSPSTIAIIAWVFAIARIVHMCLYYKIATEKNPSPRSYFYMIALLSNIVLLVIVGKDLLAAIV